jgi:hypothetical protein
MGLESRPVGLLLLLRGIMLLTEAQRHMLAWHVVHKQPHDARSEDQPRSYIKQDTCRLDLAVGLVGSHYTASQSCTCLIGLLGTMQVS